MFIKWHTTKRNANKSSTAQSSSASSSPRSVVNEFVKEADTEVVTVTDDKLYADLPPREKCPTCRITLPTDDDETRYMSCCGKIICCGCRYGSPRERCPHCDTAVPRSDEECHRRIKERIEVHNDPVAMYILGHCHLEGIDNDDHDAAFPVNYEKAAKLFQRASELGSAAAHFQLGLAYKHGRGVDMSNETSMYHLRMAAVKGSLTARFNLGLTEGRRDNHDGAMWHWMIAARCGHVASLEAVRRGFVAGYVTKQDFEDTLRAHEVSRDETRSDQRDKAKMVLC